MSARRQHIDSTVIHCALMKWVDTPLSIGIFSNADRFFCTSIKKNRVTYSPGKSASLGIVIGFHQLLKGGLP